MSMRSTLALLGVVAALAAAAATAEESTKVPGYTIHHNALTTGLLAPEVARSYGIQRSTNRGLLNVSVIKDVPGTTGEAVTAGVRATSKDIRGTIREIPMREVREGGAVYYLGEFPVEHGETLSFTVDVRPQGAAASYAATLSQEFYTR
jgi:hypothetical protein